MRVLEEEECIYFGIYRLYLVYITSICWTTVVAVQLIAEKPAGNSEQRTGGREKRGIDIPYLYSFFFLLFLYLVTSVLCPFRRPAAVAPHRFVLVFSSRTQSLSHNPRSLSIHSSIRCPHAYTILSMPSSSYPSPLASLLSHRIHLYLSLPE